MRTIYSSNDPKELKALFDQSYQYAANDPENFTKALNEVYFSNDQADLSALNPGNPADKMKLAIRVMARCIFRLGEIRGGARSLVDITDKLKGIRGDYTVSLYFGTEVYNALAKSDPGILIEMLNSGRVDDQVGAALSLLRHGNQLSQDRIKAIITSSDDSRRFALINYVDDPKFKLDVLAGALDQLPVEYSKKCWSEREIVNALASFPEGRVKLEEMRTQGRINFVKVGNIYFGSLSGSGVSTDQIQRNSGKISTAAALINKANAKFGGREQIYYVDVTPDKDEKGNQMNGAGWGNGCLYLTIGTLNDDSDRAVSFSLLHEACEQRFTRGTFSSELGITYISALEEKGPDPLIETFRLGSRIGGEYIKTGLGHPQDSEREWLAETASASIIGEPLPNKASTTLIAVSKLFH